VANPGENGVLIEVAVMVGLPLGNLSGDDWLKEWESLGSPATMRLLMMPDDEVWPHKEGGIKEDIENLKVEIDDDPLPPNPFSGFEGNPPEEELLEEFVLRAGEEPMRIPKIDLPVMGGRGPYVDPMRYTEEEGNVQLVTTPTAPGEGIKYLLRHYQTGTPLYYMFYPLDQPPGAGKIAWTPMYHFYVDKVTVDERGGVLFVRPQPRWIYVIYGQIRGEKRPRIMYGVPTKSKIRFYRELIEDYMQSWGIRFKKDYKIYTREWKKGERRERYLPRKR